MSRNVTVMGVVNVTPDSFVGEVRTPTFAGSVARVRQLVAEGATIVDIGGESTRPGATPTPLDEELQRVIPVIEVVAAEFGGLVRVSIDTRKEAVAREAVAAGAVIINDMSSMLGPVAGELGVGYVAAHMQNTPETMQVNPTYDDVVSEVLEAVVEAGRVAVDAGSPSVWIDPGIGFGKTIEHNMALLAHLDQFVETGLPVLVGVSRKGFVGRLHGASDQGTSVVEARRTGTDDRLEGSVAMAVWAGLLGVDVVRVHDVSATVQALEVVAAGLGV